MRKELWNQRPVEGGAPKPVWKQPRGSYGSNFWQMYSWKLDRVVHFYSSLERDHGVIIEADPSVASFCEQPVRITIKVDGQDRETVMDMLIQFTNGRTEYREIKYATDVQEGDDQSRAARQLAAQREWAVVTSNDFKIVTDKEIRRNPTFLGNWKQIIAYLATYAAYDLAEIEYKLLVAFDLKQSWSLKDLKHHLGRHDPQAVKVAIFRLIHGGQCTAPLDVHPLNNSLTIQRGTK